MPMLWTVIVGSGTSASTIGSSYHGEDESAVTFLTFYLVCVDHGLLRLRLVATRTKGMNRFEEP